MVAHEIRSPENVGMIVRVSEAFGCKEVVFLGNSPNLENNRVKRTSRSSEKELKIYFNQNSDQVINELQKNKYELMALEITKKSIPLKKVDFTKQDKIALLIGNERHGISENLLNIIDCHLHFDMYGKNSSMNVVNSLSVALYEITR